MYYLDFICSIYTLMQLKCNIEGTSSFELVSLGCYYVSNKIKLRTLHWNIKFSPLSVNSKRELGHFHLKTE